MAEYSTTYKYLDFPRIIYPQSTVSSYIASGIISSNGVAAGYKNGEEQIALNLYARQVRQCDTAFSFAIAETADGLKNSIAYTAPNTVTELNIGLYSMEKARRNAFTQEVWSWDYTTAGKTPTDYGVNSLATLKTNKIYTAAELLYVINSADKGAALAVSVVIATGATTAMTAIAGWVTSGSVGRESDKNYVNKVGIFYGDYNYKSDFIVRPIRSNDNVSAFGKWDTATQGIIANPTAVPPITARAAFEANTYLNDWGLFLDTFQNGIRNGANL